MKKLFLFLSRKIRKKKNIFPQFHPDFGDGVGRAKKDCNEKNDLNGGMVGSCLQVYRNEIKLGLSIAKQ